MDGKSLDITQERLNKLKEILPDSFTEGKIDREKLQASLGEISMLPHQLTANNFG